MLKVGIIGLGHMGALRMMNCLHIDGVSVVAAADQSKTALNKAKSIGAKSLYTDYHDLLNDSASMDAVIISLPHFLHSESIELALEAGLDVFVEKPLANTVEECRKIVKLMEGTGRKLMVGHSARFVDAIGKIKEMADEGRIGNLEVLTMEEVINGPFAHGIVPKPVPEWWFDAKKSGGGVLLDLGYHFFDLFRFFVRGDCKVIFSCLDHKFNLPFEDGAIVIVQSCDCSTKGIINLGWYQKSIFPQFDYRVILHGNAGYLSTDNLVPRNFYLYFVQEGSKNFLRRVVGKKIKPLSYTYYFTAYYKELHHFFDCIKKDSNPPVSAIDGLKTVELIEEAYKFSHDGLLMR